jgi:hypothetical protein
MKTNHVSSSLQNILRRLKNFTARCCLHQCPVLFGSLLLGVLLVTNNLMADAPVTLVVDMSSSGATPAADFAGLSFGTTAICGSQNFVFDTNTVQSPKCPEVMMLCSNMNVKALRIGGSSVDYKVPLVDYTYTAIDALFNFASRLGIDVIYSVRCINSSNGDDYATVDGQIAGHIWTNTYSSALNSFAIGNEPAAYPGDDEQPRITGYNTYQSKWQSIAAKICGATDASPRFSATDAAQGGNWTAQFITNRQDGVITNHILYATQHWYPGADSSGYTNNYTNAINYVLSASRNNTDYPNFETDYPDVWFNWNYRLTEADEFYNGGVHGESDTFTAALWGLDYLCWWAQATHCDGINFHNTIGKYTDTIYSDANGDWQAGAKWAAIKMFSLLYNGTRTCKSGVITNVDGVNVTSYASGDSTNCYALLINKSNYATGDEWSVMLTVMPSHFTAHNAQYIKMDAWPIADDPTQPNATVGGVTNSYSSPWNGTWTSLGVTNNACSVECRHASAVLVRMY